MHATTRKSFAENAGPLIMLRKPGFVDICIYIEREDTKQGREKERGSTALRESTFGVVLFLI